MTAGFVANARRRQRVPAFLQRLALGLLLRRSVLARGLKRASGSFLAGMSTYLFKLGPEMLGSYARPIDRHIAAALPAVSMRLRLLDMARLLAEGVAPGLEARPGKPLRLVNIGGGPVIDSLNALILARRDRPASLAGRPIEILSLVRLGPHHALLARLSGERTGSGLVGGEVLGLRATWSFRPAPPGHTTASRRCPGRGQPPCRNA